MGEAGRAENLLTETERSWAMPLRVMRTMRGEGDEDDAGDESSETVCISLSQTQPLVFSCVHVSYLFESTILTC